MSDPTSSSGIGPLRRYLLVAVAALVGGVSAGAGLRMLRVRRIVLREGRNRAVCEHNLWLIGQAISKYVGTTGSAPSSLGARVDRGLLEAPCLSCPTVSELGTEADCRYVYLPQNLGDAEQAMVTEAATRPDPSAVGERPARDRRNAVGRVAVGASQAQNAELQATRRGQPRCGEEGGLWPPTTCGCVS